MEFSSNLNNLFKNFQSQQQYAKNKFDVNNDGKIDNKDKTALTNEEKSLLKSENLFDFNNDGKVDTQDMFFVSQGLEIDGIDEIDEFEKAFLQKFKNNITNGILNTLKNNKDLSLDDLLNFENEISKMSSEDKTFWKSEIKKFEDQIIKNLQAKKDITPEEIYAFFDLVKGKDMDSTLLGNNTTWQKTLTTILTKMGTTNLSKNMTTDDLVEFEEKIETIKTEIENMNFSNAKTSAANKTAWTNVFKNFEKQIIKNLQSNTDINEDGLATMDDLQKLWKDTENVEEKVLFDGEKMSTILEKLQKNIKDAINKNKDKSLKLDSNIFNVNDDDVIDVKDIVSGDLNKDGETSLAEKIFMKINISDIEKLAKKVITNNKNVTIYDLVEFEETVSKMSEADKKSWATQLKNLESELIKNIKNKAVADVKADGKATMDDLTAFWNTYKNLIDDVQLVDNKKTLLNVMEDIQKSVKDEIKKAKNLNLDFDVDNDGDVDIDDIVSGDIDNDGIASLAEKAFMQLNKTDIEKLAKENIKNNDNVTIQDLLDFEQKIGTMSNQASWSSQIKNIENQLIENLKAKKDVTPNDILELFDAVKDKNMDSKLLGNGSTWQTVLTATIDKMISNLDKNVNINDLLELEEKLSSINNDIENLDIAKAADKKKWTDKFKKLENQIITNLQSKKDVTPNDILELFDAVKDKNMDSKLLGNGSTWQTVLTATIDKMISNLDKNVNINDLLELEEKLSSINNDIENLDIAKAADKKKWTDKFKKLENQIITNMQTKAKKATVSDYAEFQTQIKDINDIKLYNGTQLSKIINDIESAMKNALKDITIDGADGVSVFIGDSEVSVVGAPDVTIPLTAEAKVGSLEYIKECLGININSSQYNIKTDNNGRITEMTSLTGKTVYTFGYKTENGIDELSTISQVIKNDAGKVIYSKTSGFEDGKLTNENENIYTYEYYGNNKLKKSTTTTRTTKYKDKESTTTLKYNEILYNESGYKTQKTEITNNADGSVSKNVYNYWENTTLSNKEWNGSSSFYEWGPNLVQTLGIHWEYFAIRSPESSAISGEPTILIWNNMTVQDLDRKLAQEWQKKYGNK